MKLHIFIIISIFIYCLYPLGTKAQAVIVGFYNCENFYDTTNQANVVDEDFLPTSDKKYTSLAYDLKSQKIARVIYELGTLAKSDGIALMGLVEIENKLVLNKLINEPILKKYHLKFIHFDSKDARGVDVALVYNPAKFTPYQYLPFSLTNEQHFNNYATRDILFVKGLLQNKWVYILVNHWPSRRGGAKASQQKRIWASTVCKHIMDSIKVVDSLAHIIVMGDFNDNPSNKSLKMLQMANPFLKLYKNGVGSIAYNDSWQLFDQILLSSQWQAKSGVSRPELNLTNYKSIVYRNMDMIELEGKYRGYPKRTYNGNVYRGGYSDHFPVALIFTQKMTENPQ